MEKEVCNCYQTYVMDTYHPPAVTEKSLLEEGRSQLSTPSPLDLYQAFDSLLPVLLIQDADTSWRTKICIPLYITSSTFPLLLTQAENRKLIAFPSQTNRIPWFLRCYRYLPLCMTTDITQDGSSASPLPLSNLPNSRIMLLKLPMSGVADLLSVSQRQKSPNTMINKV